MESALILSLRRGDRYSICHSERSRGISDPKARPNNFCLNSSWNRRTDGIIILGGGRIKIQNPHDKFFKETFGNLEVAKDFLSNYLPSSVIKIIDVDTPEPQKDSFINKELQEGYSDLLFRVNINNREGYIYFLFEHKSYASKDIAFQLLKYMIEIWESKIKKEKIYELPIILPIVIYHGKDKWNISTTLGEMISGYRSLPEDIQKYIPSYEYLLYDISRHTDEEI